VYVHVHVVVNYEQATPQSCNPYCDRHR